MKRTSRGSGRRLIVVCCLLFVAATLVAQGALPGGVTSRLKKINDYLTSVETRLKAGSISRKRGLAILPMAVMYFSPSM